MSQALMSINPGLSLNFLMSAPNSRFSHYDSFHRLRQLFDLSSPLAALEENSGIVTLDFHSDASTLPVFEDHWQRNGSFEALLKYYLSQNRFTNDYIFASLQQQDREIEVNQKFRYPVFIKNKDQKVDSAIILFHGLNEKRWDKYLPWAHALMRLTGKAVILFPLAFHMNRVPQTWSDPRLMSEVCRERKNLLPDVGESSLANAAISHRLQFAPQRFILSGLQTFNDITALVSSIRDGQHPLFTKGAQIDFFAYSIGAFLAEVLLMTNPQKLYQKTRLFIFAGGSTLDLADPVSKFILDSAAGRTITHFFARLFETKAVRDQEIAVWQQNKSKTMRCFKSMLRHDRMESPRRKRLQKLGDRIKISALKQDTVFPLEGILSTFGLKRLPKNNVSVVDFPYPHSHENPFPAKENLKKEVDTAFLQVMEEAAEFFG